MNKPSKSIDLVREADRRRAILASFIFQTNRYGYPKPRTSTDILMVCPAVFHLLFRARLRGGLPTPVFGEHAPMTATAITRVCDSLVRLGYLKDGKPEKVERKTHKGDSEVYDRRRFLLTESGFNRALGDHEMLPHEYLPARGRESNSIKKNPWIKTSGFNPWKPDVVMQFIAFAGIRSPMPTLDRVRRSRTYGEPAFDQAVAQIEK